MTIKQIHANYIHLFIVITFNKIDKKVVNSFDFVAAGILRTTSSLTDKFKLSLKVRSLFCDLKV